MAKEKVFFERGKAAESDSKKKFRKILFGGEYGIYQKHLMNYLLSFVPKKSFGKVLDLGCAKGYLLSAFPESARYGIDLDKKALNETKLKGNFKFASCTKIPFKANEFDLILSSHLFEHLEEKELFDSMKEIQRTAKKDSYLIVILPNIEELKWNFFNPWDHKTIITRERLKTLFEIHGFTPIKSFTYNRLFPNWFQFLFLKISPYLFFSFLRLFNKELVMIGKKSN
ncbi:MAG: class I SAM-dependent methyltransferase [Candidatus Diapherotrites archaeon]